MMGIVAKIQARSEKFRMENPYAWRELFGWENRWPVPRKILWYAPWLFVLTSLTVDMVYLRWAVITPDWLGAVLILLTMIVFLTTDFRKEEATRFYIEMMQDESKNDDIRAEMIWLYEHPLFWFPWGILFFRHGVFTGFASIGSLLNLTFFGLIVIAAIFFRGYTKENRYKTMKKVQRDLPDSFYQKNGWVKTVLLSAMGIQLALYKEATLVFLFPVYAVLGIINNRISKRFSKTTHQ